MADKVQGLKEFDVVVTQAGHVHVIVGGDGEKRMVVMCLDPIYAQKFAEALAIQALRGMAIQMLSNMGGVDELERGCEGVEQDQDKEGTQQNAKPIRVN